MKAVIKDKQGNTLFEKEFLDGTIDLTPEEARLFATQKHAVLYEATDHEPRFVEIEFRTDPPPAEKCS